MKYFVYQGNDHDCGYASLKMLMANITKNKSYLFMPKPRQKEYFSLDDIKREAQNNGLLLKYYRCDLDYYEKLQVPSLTLINNNHVVMIKKVKKNNIILYNPETGIEKVPKDEFLKQWDRVIIEVDSSKYLKTTKKYRHNVLPNWMRILEGTFSLLSAGILIACFYLLNNQKNAMYSAIFILAFAIFQIADNIIIHKEINFFDNQYIRPYFSQRKNQTKLKYIEFIGFKQNFFTKSRNLLSSILIAFTITFLLCINDFRNIFAIFALVILKVFELFITNKSDEKDRRQIETFETECVTQKENAVDLALKANKLANNKVKEKSMISIAYILAAFGFAITMMFITGNYGCNFVIFHFGLYYTGFNAYSQVINYFSFRKESYKTECKFFDECNL